MKIVLDTNVAVSGLLNPFNPPGEVVRMISANLLVVCYDARIFSEYRKVLVRPKFQLEPFLVEGFLDQVRADGFLVSAEPLRDRLPDPDDEIFLAVALAGKARCLVTGNLKDFPASQRQGMSVVSPKEFLEIYGREKT